MSVLRVNSGTGDYLRCSGGNPAFRWHWCITGELTEEEIDVSAIMASMWTQVTDFNQMVV